MTEWASARASARDAGPRVQGIRGNMRRLFGLEPLAGAGFLEGARRPAAFQRLAWALAFFHALVQARAPAETLTLTHARMVPPVLAGPALRGCACAAPVRKRRPEGTSCRGAVMQGIYSRGLCMFQRRCTPHHAARRLASPAARSAARSARSAGTCRTRSTTATRASACSSCACSSTRTRRCGAAQPCRRAGSRGRRVRRDTVGARARLTAGPTMRPGCSGTSPDALVRNTVSRSQGVSQTFEAQPYPTLTLNLPYQGAATRGGRCLMPRWST